MDKDLIQLAFQSGSSYTAQQYRLIVDKFYKADSYTITKFIYYFKDFIEQCKRGRISKYEDRLQTISEDILPLLSEREINYKLNKEVFDALTDLYFYLKKDLSKPRMEFFVDHFLPKILIPSLHISREELNQIFGLELFTKKDYMFALIDRADLSQDERHDLMKKLWLKLDIQDKFFIVQRRDCPAEILVDGWHKCIKVLNERKVPNQVPFSDISPEDAVKFTLSAILTNPNTPEYILNDSFEISLNRLSIGDIKGADLFKSLIFNPKISDYLINRFVIEDMLPDSFAFTNNFSKLGKVLNHPLVSQKFVRKTLDRLESEILGLASTQDTLQKNESARFLDNILDRKILEQETNSLEKLRDLRVQLLDHSNHSIRDLAKKSFLEEPKAIYRANLIVENKSFRKELAKERENFNFSPHFLRQISNAIYDDQFYSFYNLIQDQPNNKKFYLYVNFVLNSHLPLDLREKIEKQALDSLSSDKSLKSERKSSLILLKAIIINNKNAYLMSGLTDNNLKNKIDYLEKIYLSNIKYLDCNLGKKETEVKVKKVNKVEGLER